MQTQSQTHLPRSNCLFATLITIGLSILASQGQAFVSGSTGADGAFNPSVNTQVLLPPSGVFNYTTVNIPVGVTVTFAKNATNTPVVMLASENVTIAGTINISGTDAAPVGTQGGGAIGDDGSPGVGGPGGYSGGRGGGPAMPFGLRGGNGLGPGGGEGGFPTNTNPRHGGSAGYAVNGSGQGGLIGSQAQGSGGGLAYGSQQLLPLIGGSGGGGAGGGTTFTGSGGGGGGGAILIASSGTISIASTGRIYAYGAAGWNGQNDTGGGGIGGAGSGGGVRLIATTISGNGTVNAYDAAQQGGFINYSASVGFIRMESESFTFTGSTNPVRTFAAPGPVFIAGQPTVSITSVAGTAVPAAPTGIGDVQLPANTVNPVTVNFQTTGIPVGNTVKLSVVPASGPATSVTSSALTGSTNTATASVSATLPTGPSTLLATVTYTIVVALGDALSTYAENQRVERVEVTASLGGKSDVRLITANGRSYPAPPEAQELLYGRVAANGS